jgi:hypothetical protein
VKESDLKEIRKAYILAKALNVQYQFIRELVNPELKKSVNEAKAKNSHVIKIVNDYFSKRNVTDSFIENEEELAFQFLEELDKITKL